MNIKNIIEESNLKISKDRILYNEPMKKHTSFKIGGPAECLIKVTNKEELKEVLNLANKNEIPVNIIGNGSNVLVLDEGISGITVIMKIEGISFFTLDDKKFIVKIGAGEKIAKVGKIILNNSLTGFEEISGIPGTLGGAVRMNAGANGKEMKDIVKTVSCIDRTGNEKTFNSSEMKFGYRESIIKGEKYIVTEVEIELEKGIKEEIKEKMDRYAKSRKEKQPLEYPSAGSVFKRGEDYITAKLIDEAGLKGYSVGDAEISKKHAGFIINKGNATAKDVLELVNKVKEEIYKKYHKKIELEVCLIGDSPHAYKMSYRDSPQ